MPNEIIPLGVTPDGEFVVPPTSIQDFGRMAQAEAEDPPQGIWATAQRVVDSLLQFFGLDHMGDVADLTPEQKRNPADPNVGWGLVFAKDTPPEVRAALKPLLAHRAGRELADWDTGKALKFWLAKEGITPQERDTTNLPYYLLLVGNPQQIPFEAQYELDRLRAVGRLDLGTEASAYQTYVASVLAHEAQPQTAPIAVFAAARNGPRDDATQLSGDHLIPGLVKTFQAEANLKHTLQLLDAPTLPTLKQALRPADGGPSPALVFVAGHGMTLKPNDAQLQQLQGAWLTSEWQRGYPKPKPLESCLTAAHVGPDFCAPGSVIFSLACFGAGTTPTSEYARFYNRLHLDALETQHAPAPFTAALAQKLLSYQHQGQPAAALAYIGHVDLSWGSSFWDADNGKPRLLLWETFTRRLLNGDTVGMAADRLADEVNDYHQQLANLAEANAKDDATLREAGWAWIGRNNARGFIILGDPAVRLALPQP